MSARPSSTTTPSASTAPLSLYDDAHAEDRFVSSLVLRTTDRATALPLHTWRAPASAADAALLTRFTAGLRPRARVLQLLSGPGRQARWLSRHGHEVLAVDPSANAVRLVEQDAVPGLCADPLGPLPRGDHGWDGVLLLDGSIGLGGDPLLLLCRVRDLLAPDGRVLVELADDGPSTRTHAVLDDGRRTSRSFPWARLAADDALRRSARLADLELVELWSDGGSFAVLRAGAPPTGF